MEACGLLFVVGFFGVFSCWGFYVAIFFLLEKSNSRETEKCSYYLPSAISVFSCRKNKCLGKI